VRRSPMQPASSTRCATTLTAASRRPESAFSKARSRRWRRRARNQRARANEPPRVALARRRGRVQNRVKLRLEAKEKLSMADERPVRFGVLGAARIAPNALIKPAREVEEAEVVAIAARDRKRARRFAKEHKIPRVYATYD